MTKLPLALLLRFLDSIIAIHRCVVPFWVSGCGVCQAAVQPSGPRVGGLDAGGHRCGLEASFTHVLRVRSLRSAGRAKHFALVGMPGYDAIGTPPTTVVLPVKIPAAS